MASNTSFFSFSDANGIEVIVQRLADVPEQYRAQAKHIDLSKPAINLPAKRSENSPAQAKPADALGPFGNGTSLNVPSFILGTGTGLTLGLIAMLVFRRSSRFLSLILGVVVFAALGIGYLTYIRQKAGLPGSTLATPATLLEDARTAAGALNKRNVEQEQALKEIDHQR